MAKNDGERKIDRKLIKIYEQYGLKDFLGVCSELLNIKTKDEWEKKRKMNGEVCEVVLRVMTMDYLKRNKMTGDVFQSMILRNLSDRMSDFRTELDFTVLTPGICLTGECKSFVGDIVATDKCLLTRGDYSADVGKQSLVHARALRQYLDKYTLPDLGLSVPPFGCFCFLYSNGTITDKRSSSNKADIPILTISTLDGYYDKLFARYKRTVYDYEKLRKVFKGAANSKALHEQHRDYLHY